MARRTILADDLTDTEIDGTGVSASVALTLIRHGEDPIEVKVDWDLSNYTAEALYALVSSADLAGFVSDMRPLVKTAGTEQTDSEIIRKWYREAHPEGKIGDKGRIPAEIRAMYRREIVGKTEAGDSVK